MGARTIFSAIFALQVFKLVLKNLQHVAATNCCVENCPPAMLHGNNFYDNIDALKIVPCNITLRESERSTSLRGHESPCRGRYERARVEESSNSLRAHTC